ncbi:MtrAB system histidine kinase MtrB [Agromyces marinus]|uniref:Sensor histidine kinase MtrB n=1 Tax=Agromyces marinus TaxID=1389020 RepID=A0ABN0HKD8_9MICO|nr:MtrAB system histidine kinase MtrB [Agromyces marinus]UIP58077.1 Sensor histidine kinase MtrB [Agromyces marinus]BDZ53699.1 two-component sensor histidine kinase [Agromyces marinus]
MSIAAESAERATGWVRRGVRRFGSAWRHSLQFRTVLITLGLSSLAILVIGFTISFTVASNLFQGQVERVLGLSSTARAAAQASLDASDAADRASVQAVTNSAVRTVIGVSGSSDIALFRTPDTPAGSIAPPDFLSPDLGGRISAELRERVQGNPEGQYWQSIELPDQNGEPAPGIVVGTDLLIPGAGRYELYIGYDLADTEQTLAFMQLTGAVGAVALIALLSAITLIVVRWLIEPILAVAATSRRLAAGDLGVRVPAKGEDELAALAEAFNGMADTLQARIRDLAELSVMQQRFVSDVSHELRTPLTTIRLAGDVLYGQREDFPPATARTAELLRTQTERFETLLADLLEISRYDAGSVELESEPTNLVHLAEESIESMRALAADHGSDLRLEAPGGHLDAEVDPRRIQRIVRNLLGNAIEHGEGRPVVLSVDSNATAVALSVRDYGLGMSEEAAARVFDRFWRADPSRRRSIGGTGLGLAIALEDAVAHGGTLDVWSREGRGSVFRLVLPRVRDASVRIVAPLELEPPDPDAAGPDASGPDAHGPDSAGPGVPAEEVRDA